VLITFVGPRRVFLYTFRARLAHSVLLDTEVLNEMEIKKNAANEEDSAKRMQRLAEEMRFRIRESMAQRGGSEAFLNWLRTDAGKQA